MAPIHIVPVYFFPFFFFLPPPCPPVDCCGAGAGVTDAVVVGAESDVFPSVVSTSILSSAAGPVVGGAVDGSSIVSPAANLPKPSINLPTSACLSVLYFKHIPDPGSYVLNVNVAGLGFGCLESPAAELSVIATSPFVSAFFVLRGKFFDFSTFEEFLVVNLLAGIGRSGGGVFRGRVYFVVMRVVEG